MVSLHLKKLWFPQNLGIWPHRPHAYSNGCFQMGPASPAPCVLTAPLGSHHHAFPLWLFARLLEVIEL